MESRKLGNIYGFDGGNYAGNVYDKNDIAPTLLNMQGGNRQPMIIEEIKKYGNKNGNYVPYDGAACYPLHTQDFIRTGFQDISYTLSARDYKDPKCVIVKGGTEIIQEVKELGFMDNGTGKHQSNTVVDEKGVAPTVTTVNGGGTQQIKVLTEVEALNTMPDGTYRTIKSQYGNTSSANFMYSSTYGATGAIETVRIKQATKDGYIECKVGGVADLSFPDSTTRRGRVQDGGDVCPTLMAGEQDICRIEKADNGVLETYSPYVNKKHEEFYKENGYIPEFFNPYNKTELMDIAPTLTAQGESITKSGTVLKCDAQYRIRKLTPRECWRLMAVSDEDFEKVKFKKEILFLEGSEDKCNAKLMVVNEKQTQENMETYVSCTTKDIQDTEILKTIWKQSAEMQEQERKVYVNFAIEKLEELVLSECATNTIKCIDFMGMHFFVIKNPEQQVTDIIARVKTGKQNTEKYMKIITESNLNQSKLYIILTLFVQIIESKIFTSTTLKVSIKGYIMPTTNCENSFQMMLSNLKMESIKERTSNSALYKQAGNSIVVNCLVAIFSQMGIQGIPRWNEGLSEKYK